ncbi:phosphatidylcholine and lysophosphatidylcholine phospholipase, partial [Coemansia sp. RSA 2559]
MFSILCTTLVSIAVVVGFLVFDVLVPLFMFAIHVLLYTTTSIRAAVCAGLVGAICGLYYFRYFYAAPKKSPVSDPKRSSKPPDRHQGLLGFDLRPDVIHLEDADDTSYADSLEARGSHSSIIRGKRTTSEAVSAAAAAGLAGVGFPADFLSMFMKSISIFGYIEEPVFREFSRQLQTRRLLAGERMFDSEEDRDDQNFYVVIDGQVQIYLAESTTVVPAAECFPSGAESDAGAPGADGWADGYDEGGHGYSSDLDSAQSLNSQPVDRLSGSASRPAQHRQQTPSPPSSASTGAASSAILLNVVGPGDVLSSLFSILSLFTDGVPLRPGFGERQTFNPNAATSVASSPITPQYPGHQAFMDDRFQMAMHGNSQGQAKSAISPREYQQTFIAQQALSSTPPASHEANKPFAFPENDANDESQAAQPPNSSGGIFGHIRQEEADVARSSRPNVVARATTDTTLAMIPASAFQRVTRLYPKAASHILQVILTRLQRVTFATLYDYLDLPGELVSIERAISNLARYPPSNDLAHSSTMQDVKTIYEASHSADLKPTQTSQSPTPGRMEPLFSNRASPASSFATTSYALRLGSGNTLQASWKITHSNLQAVAKKVSLRQAVLPVLVSDLDTGHGDGARAGIESKPAMRDVNSVSTPRHRRSGSDSARGPAVPKEEDLESLRKSALYQMCNSLGLNPHSADGRYSHSPGERYYKGQHGTSSKGYSAQSASSSASVSRRPSAHRGLPRTEHILPLLQQVNVTEGRRNSGGTPPMPLADIPSLVDELELYMLPDGFALVEQGQRPHGLY